MLNSSTIKLDQILTMGQSSSNRNGLGYTSVANTVATTFKIVYVKAALITKKSLIFGKNSNPLLSESKKKRFVPICHYCNKLVTFVLNVLNIEIHLK